MASFQAPGAARGVDSGPSAAPLVALFERDDSIAVPLLSQVRLAGYDVRAARTAVELFDVLGKHSVALVLIDLGGATAGRREFWVALDARRRGRPLQVMTFRIKDAPTGLEPDEATARALADVEVWGPQEFSQIIEGVRSRLPLHGGNSRGIAMGTLPPGMALPSDASPQFGRALGAISSFMPIFSPGPPSQSATLFGQPGPGSSPFAQPSQINPFSASFPDGSLPGSSRFSQPYNSNPFGSEPFSSNPFGSNPFGADSNPGGYASSNSPPGVFSQMRAAPAQPGGARPWGAPSQPNQSSQPGAFGASQPSGKTPAQPSIADRWTPPDRGAAARAHAFDQQETGVAPGLAFRPIEKAPEKPLSEQMPGAGLPGGWMAAVRAAAASGVGSKPLSPQDEQALSNVLVEGALLSPQTLEVLRGVQQMLSTVEMKLNIGELAMIFNFLSHDQYLAALLVSRGLVSPQQIASLGRVKQELAAAGKDYDLGTLLVQYKALTAEQLASIHAEFGGR